MLCQAGNYDRQIKVCIIKIFQNLCNSFLISENGMNDTVIIVFLADFLDSDVELVARTHVTIVDRIVFHYNLFKVMELRVYTFRIDGLCSNGENDVIVLQVCFINSVTV